MKIIMFSAREEECIMSNEWGKKHGIEIKNVSEPLTMENINLVKGYDGLCLCQIKKIGKKIYKELNAIGITQISSRTAGVDMFDIFEATKHGLTITNVPVYSPNAIAEYAVAASLNITRHVMKIAEAMKRQDYRWTKDILSKEIRSMTVGIVGTGRIGCIAARIFKAFGAKVIGFDLYPNDKAKDCIEYVDTLDELAKQADLISLHMPATKDNFHLFDKTMFDKMKDGVFLVNTARGTIVDTKALIEALDSGKVAAAALDTYENEGDYYTYDFSGKKVSDEILKELTTRNDVLITPHTAFYTEEAVKALVEGGLDGVYDVIENGVSENKVS
ncbi:D-2-hydroxyacid dehydrogenase [Clostridium psychrophilum]|uniref:D-2-hydroxyacid dehydrogenase n=1 Tax=Clostridium psychrophilum TaxID=132926 RepID=UPI001C0B71EC|nr:D-2-hydroxyacid dehydrogenase [Clostridium psychrophilum]MBU3181413.1 D-2-hydroxyacid dehydrogenase [Clostridium psychrophilum]